VARNLWRPFVFNEAMKIFTLALAAAAAGAVALPAAASASEVQLGVTTTPLVAPTCPAGIAATACTIVVPEQTALETVRDGDDYPTTITQPGEVVSFTLGISELSATAATQKSEISYLDGQYGGDAEAAVTILRPIAQKKSFRWTVAAESSPVPLQGYLGKVVEFPLAESLPVVPGEVVAVTVPTWAPILSIDVSKTQFAYRQSRSGNCTNSTKLPAYFNPQLTIGQQAAYGCDYTGTRPEYSATEITTPSAAADFRAANRKPRIVKR
jgi:hypothetical protein